MLKHIKYAVFFFVCTAMFLGCATEKLIEKEESIIEKEKSAVTQAEPARQTMPQPKETKAQPSPLAGKTITLTADKAFFSDVFSALAEKADLDLVIDSRLANRDYGEVPKELSDAGKGKPVSHGPVVLPPVSIAFKNTPLKDALENLTSSLHIFYEIKGRTLFIRGTESRTYHLNFLSAQKETKVSVGGDVIGYAQGSSPSGANSSGSTPLSGEFSIRDTTPVANSDIYAQIEEVVKTCLTTNGTYSMNRALGFLEVNDMGDALERIDAHINTIKKYYNSQILITAKIIDVSLNDSSQYGIDWTSIHGNISDYVFNPIQQNLALSTNGITPALEIQVHSDKHGFDAALNALKEYGDIKVLSNPQVRVTNGQPALISVGTNTSYIQEIKLTTTTTQGGTTITSPDVTVGSIFDGIMLGVLPNIDLETNSVNLSITPIKSRVVKLDERTISGNVYTLPTLDLEESTTQVRVKGGNIIVLGGLISKNTTRKTKSIPVLGDIPLLGYLFSQQIKGVETNELVILLEPVILTP
ncbi:MAG: hypothetical protein ABFD70_00180 [Syntrophaceae bacterium]|nr:hypothetical protein [Deltaproteobacteria bacterium]